jgi:hypothetical protein
LAYYVKWHMNEAWRPLLFCDEDQAAKNRRDPVAPSLRSKDAMKKVASRRLEDESTVHSFTTLIQRLAGIVRNICYIPASKSGATFEIVTTPDKTQQRALSLVEAIKM